LLNKCVSCSKSSITGKVRTWTARLVWRYDEHAVIIPRRRLIALAAAYAIALQALLSGFALLTAGADLCAAATTPAAPHSSSDCGCCPLLCGAAADLAAASVGTPPSPPLSSPDLHRDYVGMALPSLRGLVPPSRAPPVA
jgi:hypothetical protein